MKSELKNGGMQRCTVYQRIRSAAAQEGVDINLHCLELVKERNRVFDGVASLLLRVFTLIKKEMSLRKMSLRSDKPQTVSEC